MISSKHDKYNNITKKLEAFLVCTKFKIQRCKEIITDFRVSESWYSTTVVLQLLAIKHKDLMGYKHQSAFFCLYLNWECVSRQYKLMWYIQAFNLLHCFLPMGASVNLIICVCKKVLSNGAITSIFSDFRSSENMP